MALQIKICGLTTKEAVDAAIKNNVSYIGCSFAKSSPRNVRAVHAQEITLDVPHYVSKVAVLIETEPSLLEEIFASYKPQYLQFDGNTEPQEIEKIKARFKTKAIVNIRANSLDGFGSGLDKYNDVADIFLLDAPDPLNQFIDVPENTFDWSLISKLEFARPWILSGGLNMYNVRNAVRDSRAQAINASSTLEEYPGMKSAHLIKEFIKAARKSLYVN